MKKLTLLLAMLAIAFVTYGQTSYGDWDGADTTYSGFEGAAVSVVANPNTTGNTSANVLAVNLDGSESPYAGCQSGIPFPGTMNVGDNSVFTLDVLAPVAGQFLFKVTNTYYDCESIEVIVDITTPGVWTPVTIDLSTGNSGWNNDPACQYQPPIIQNGIYNRIVMIPDFNVDAAGTGAVWYVDNISGPDFTQCTTDCDPTLSDISVDGTPVAGFNPDILSYTVVIAEPAAAYPSITATNTQAGGSWSITSTTEPEVPGNVVITSLSPNGSVSRDYTVYFVYERVFNFDAEIGHYSYTSFDGGRIVDTINWVGGTNTSANVYKVSKAFYDPGWGFDIVWGGGLIHMTSAVDFNAGVTFSMDVYSPEVGDTILLKFEDYGSGKAEAAAVTTVANEWETLTFDFLNPKAGTAINNAFYKLVIMPDFGAIGEDPAKVWAIDNIMQLGSGSGVDPCPVDTDGDSVIGVDDLKEVIKFYGTSCE
jgi:hypothetical protein